MDHAQLLELAKQTITYLSPLLATAAGNTITDAAKQLARRTWQLLQKRFAGNVEAVDDLAHYAKQPNNRHRQEAVVEHIVARFADDDAARSLAQLVEEARRLSLLSQPGSGGQTHNLTIGGNARVGTAIAGNVQGGLSVGPISFGETRQKPAIGDVEGGTVNIGADTASVEPDPTPSGGTRADGIGVNSSGAPQLQTMLEFPTKLAVGSDATLVMRLADVPQGIATRGALSARLTGRGFIVQSDVTQLLALDAAGAASVQFAVTAQEAGPRSLRLDIVQQDRVIDSIFAPCRVVTPEELATQPTFIEVGAPAPATDLELRIKFDQDDDRVLQFTLRSPNHRAPFHDEDVGTIRLRREPRDYLKSVYESLSKLARAKPTTTEDVAHNQHLAVKLGRMLWEELVPAALKDAYWRIDHSVQTFLITSDEPWIPWELIKPYRFATDTSREDGPFWCERFSLARWLTQSSVATTLPFSRVQPVAPSSSNLAHVQAELGLFNTLAEELPLEVAAPVSRPVHVVQIFESGDMQVLHVAAHGGFDSTQADNAAITLTGGSLKPSDVVARFDGQTRDRPLVFINACHGARADFAFTGVGGWADRLVRDTQVGAFIGTAWEVDDRLALLFAQTFYAALVREHETIGESFRQARLVVRDAAPANSTWLAYVLYADPLARAVMAPA